MPFTDKDITDSTNLHASALAKHLDCSIHDLRTDGEFSHATAFWRDDEEYLVLLPKEAEQKAMESVRYSLWAFNTGFLSHFVSLSDRAWDAIKKLQEELCEDCQPIIEALIGEEKLASFIREAIAQDGKGHFLSSYDDEEHRVIVDNVTFYVYRLN